ncbi:MAG: hypothetical protein AAGL69_08655 [Pseudomonadota bacterium]
MRALWIWAVLMWAPVAVAEIPQEFGGDGEKAVYCYYSNLLRMQFAGAVGIDQKAASELLNNAQRWQDVIAKEIPDMGRQAQLLQSATSDITGQINATGARSVENITGVLAPIVAECDTLLSRLDAPAEAPRPEPAAVATVEPSGPYDEDMFAGLITRPLRGRFRWDWHDSEYADVRTEGTLSRSTGRDNAYRLKFDSKITALCVGELVESHRSEDGYLMHLTTRPGTDQGCKPKVAEALLYPRSADTARENRSLHLRLYDDQRRLIASSLFRSEPLRDKHIDPQALVSLDEVVRRRDEGVRTQRRGEKLAQLRANPEFSRLEPFYDSCSRSASTISGVDNEEYYCVCMTYKFGLGDRIPEPEFVSYTEDFSRLTAQFAVYTEDNRMYTRLAETCQRCSYPDNTLNARCNEMDTQMFSPSTFAGMLRQLDKKEVKLWTSDFYKESFFVVYLQGYSDYCSAELIDPVPFDYVVTETTTDPYAGSFSQEVQRDRTYVERRHAARYQAIYDEHGKLSPDQFWNKVRGLAITSEAELRRSQRDLQQRISIEAERRSSIRQHLEGGCRSESVQRVYNNLESMFD